MTEHQYYDFLAVDRPLNDRQQAGMRSLSIPAGRLSVEINVLVV